MWSTLSTLQSYGTQLIETTETYAKELAKELPTQLSPGSGGGGNDTAFDGVVTSNGNIADGRTDSRPPPNSTQPPPFNGSQSSYAPAASPRPSVASPRAPASQQPSADFSLSPRPSISSSTQATPTADPLEHHERENQRLQATLDALKTKAKDKIQQLQATVTTLTAELAEMRDSRARQQSVTDAEWQEQVDAAAAEIEKLEAARQTLTDQQAQTAAALTAREQQITRLMGELAAKDDTIQSLEEKGSNNTTSNATVAELQRKIDTYEMQLVRLQQSHAEQLAAVQLELEQKLLADGGSDEPQMVNELKEASIATEAKLKASMEDNETLHQKLAQHETTIESLQAERAADANSIEQLKQQAAEQKSLADSIAAELIEKNRQAEELKQQQSTVSTSQLQQIEAEYESKLTSAVTEHRQALAAAEQQLSDSHAENLQLKEELSTAKANGVKLNDRVNELQSLQISHAEELQAYAGQIKELHKSTAVMRSKDAELQKKHGEMAALQREIEQLTTTISQRDSALFEAELKFQQCQQQLDTVQQEFLQTTNALQERAALAGRLEDQERKLTRQLAEAQAQSAQQSENITDLTRQLEEATNEIASLSQSTKDGQAAAEEREHLKAVAESLRQELEKSVASLETCRRELTTQTETIHSQQLLIDDASETQAQLVARYEAAGAQLRADHAELVRKSRDSANELESVRSQFAAVSGQLTELKGQISSLQGGISTKTAEISQLRSELATSRSQSADSVRQLRASLAESESKLQAATARLKATEEATSTSPRPTADELQQWAEKYQLVEQENIRLRERSLRTEQLLQSSSNVGGGMRRGDAPLMADVKVFPWLDGKYEDAVDGDNGESGLLPASADRHAPRLRGVSTLWPFMRGRIRRSLRTADIACVQFGQWLKQRPEMRMGWMVYAVLMHAVLLALLFTGSGGADQHQPPNIPVDQT